MPLMVAAAHKNRNGKRQTWPLSALDSRFATIQVFAPFLRISPISRTSGAKPRGATSGQGLLAHSFLCQFHPSTPFFARQVYVFQPCSSWIIGLS
jgi:hypothetical protein